MWNNYEGKFVTEISTLECNNAMKCPKCGRPITMPQPVREKDGEVIKWEPRCTCGARMIIFND